MEKYIKPEITEEYVEMEDICFASTGLGARFKGDEDHNGSSGDYTIWPW